MAKKNIMIVISSIGGAGAELVVYNLCRNIDTEKFNVSVCHLKERGRNGDILVRDGFKVHELKESQTDTVRYLSAYWLRKRVIQNKIDLLHSHNIEPLFDCGLCKIITPKVKLVHTYHYGNYPCLPLRYLFLEGFYSRIADELVAVGYNQKRQIASTYRINQERIRTVYNGIVLQGEKRDNRKDDVKGPDPGKIIIGSICTFIYQKGIDYLLRIANEIRYTNPEVVFWVAGDGPLRAELEQQRCEMGLQDTVRFLGWVPDAAQNVIPKIDIFMQTSRWEAMSMVILEAMASGKPIIATDVGENRKIVEAAGAGFIVQAGDVQETIDCAKALIKKPELRIKMGRNGKTAVYAQYTVATMTRQYEAIYSEVLRM